jgi:hypothetical protein
LKTEDSLRAHYMSSFKDSAWSADFARQYGLNPAHTAKVITASYGNWKEIVSFIQNIAPEKRLWAMEMLNAITEKDLRDTRESVLRDHIDHAFLYDGGLSASDPEFFARYVMSGRIANEMMLPWRSFLQKKFDADFARKARQDISTIVEWIKGNIHIDETANLHSRSPLSPRGVYELKVSDKQSRDQFFVALCRSMAIPARINPGTGIPQYRTGNSWLNMVFEPGNENGNATGFVHFVNNDQGFQPKYAINFTIARLHNGVYRSVDLDYGKPLGDFPDSLTVEAGNYYLVTGNRLSDGSVLSSVTFFEVQPGKMTDIRVDVRETIIKTKPVGTINPDDYSFRSPDQKTELSLGPVTGLKGAILVWLQPGKEPSKHVLADIPAVRVIIEKWGGGVVFILPADEKEASFHPGNFKGLPSQSIFTIDNDGKLLSRIEKLAGHELKTNFPLVVIIDKQGNIVFFSEGYKIGIGEQLAKEINRMHRN